MTSISFLLLADLIPPGSTALLAAAGLLVVLTGFVAFAAGAYYARQSTSRSARRAQKSIERLYSYVSESLDGAQQACRMLETFPKLQLSLERLQRLEQRQSDLMQTIGRIADSQLQPQPVEEPPQEAMHVPPVEWILAPEDSVTKLPGRQAFDENFERLQQAGSEPDLQHSLLLVKIDKHDHLKARFGIAGVQSFSRLMAGVVCRAMRENDVACQIGTDTLAVLIPGGNRTTGGAVADAIRRAIRRHNFRTGENGPEVLVTASFGLVVFNATDPAENVLNRARTAVSKSEKRGRNQLHIDNGSKLELCPTSR